MALTHWQVKFLYNTGDLISAWKFNQEHQQIYDALNFLEDNKLHLDGSQAMTGNLMIAKALAGILFKNADNDICRIIVGSQEINLTANADTSDGTTWNRDDANKPAFRLRLFYKDGTTQTALIFYSAAAAANPITWTENWRILQDGSIKTSNIQINNDGSIVTPNWIINSDGTTNIKLIGETALESYDNTTRTVPPNSLLTVATLNLTVPPGPNRRYFIEGFVNASWNGGGGIRINEMSTTIISQGTGIIGRLNLGGSRIRTLSPGTYTYTLVVGNSSISSTIPIYESNLIIIGGQPV